MHTSECGGSLWVTREGESLGGDPLGDEIIKGVFDPYAGLKGKARDAYEAARNAGSNAGALKMLTEYGPIKINGSTFDVVKQTGGMDGVLWGPLKNDVYPFLYWMTGHRSERLAAEGRENLISAKDQATFKAMNKGQTDYDYTLSSGKVTRNREAIFLDSLAKYDAIQRNVMDFLVDSGLQSRPQAEKLLANSHYVPYFREAKADGGRFGASGNGITGQTAFKKLEGGKEKILDPFENIYKNLAHLVDAALKNNNANIVIDSTVKLGGGIKVTPKQYELMSQADKDSTVWTMVNGEKTYTHIADADALRALTAVNNPGLTGPVMDVQIGRAHV